MNTCSTCVLIYYFKVSEDRESHKRQIPPLFALSASATYWQCGLHKPVASAQPLAENVGPRLQLHTGVSQTPEFYFATSVFWRSFIPHPICTTLLLPGAGRVASHASILSPTTTGRMGWAKATNNPSHPKIIHPTLKSKLHVGVKQALGFYSTTSVFLEIVPPSPVCTTKFLPGVSRVAFSSLGPTIAMVYFLPKPLTSLPNAVTHLLH